MTPTVEQIYSETISPLSGSDQLRLARLILNNIPDASIGNGNNAPQEANGHLESRVENAPEAYEDYHLENRNGLWVIAGGPPISPEDANRDWVREEREERMRSFFPAELRNVPLDDDYA